MPTVGERLRRARERKNLKQIQVMEKTGINNKTLSGYENNVSEPDLHTLNVLADLYEVPMEYFTGKVNNPNQTLSRGAKQFLDAIDLSDEQAIDKLKTMLVHNGKPLPAEALKEILKYARYRIQEGDQ